MVITKANRQTFKDALLDANMKDSSKLRDVRRLLDHYGIKVRLLICRALFLLCIFSGKHYGDVSALAKRQKDCHSPFTQWQHGGRV